VTRIGASGRLAEAGIIRRGVRVGPQHPSAAALGAAVAGADGSAGQGGSGRRGVLSVEFGAGGLHLFGRKSETGRGDTAGQVEGAGANR